MRDPICPGCQRPIPVYSPFCDCGRKNDKFDREEFEREVGCTLEEVLAECDEGRTHERFWRELEAVGEAVDHHGYCQWCGIPLPPLD